MKQQTDEIFRSVKYDVFNFSLRIVDQEYDRNYDCYLDNLSLNMRSAKIIAGERLLDLEDHKFLVEFLEALLEAAERPYVQATIDALLAAPLVAEDGEVVDAES